MISNDSSNNDTLIENDTNNNATNCILTMMQFKHRIITVITVIYVIYDLLFFFLILFKFGWFILI